MQVLSESQIQQNWYSTRSEEDRLHSGKDGFFFTHPEASSIGLDYPKVERLPFFARYLATLGYEESDFGGALLWRRTWGVWNGLQESIGYRIVEQMNRSAGQSCAFEAAPGYQFRSDELTEAVGLLMQPMIFAWDAFFVPQFNYGVEEFFLKVSHDSHVVVRTKTTEFNEKVFEKLQQLNLNPRRLKGLGGI